jgi:APA family basic amino acid/polyamine antiporter
MNNVISEGRAPNARVGLSSVVALGLGTAVGVAIFSALAPGAALAGTGLLAAIVIAACPVAIVAVTYAFMGSALPLSGASYEWTRQFLQPLAGFLLAWLRIASNVATMNILAATLYRYLSTLVPLPGFTISILLFVSAIFGINLVHARFALTFQAALMAVLLVAFGAFVVSGAPSLAAANFAGGLHPDWVQVAMAAPILVALFFGVESITEIGEEIANPRRHIPLAIALCVGFAVVVYLSIAVTVLGTLGAPQLARSGAPLLASARKFMGPYAAPFIAVTAAIAIAKSMNAIFIVFVRSIYAMGRAGVLPTALGRLHPGRDTPEAAVVVTYLLCVAGIFLPRDLTFLFLAMNVPTLLKYIATCASALCVVKAYPAIYAAAKFKLSPAGTTAWAYAGIAAAGLLIMFGIGADWKPYLALGGWTLVGVAYYFGFSRRDGSALAENGEI